MYRATDPSIAPGATGSTLLSSGRVTNTGNSIVMDDTAAPPPDTPYWYTLFSTDGTQVLNSVASLGFTTRKSPLVLGIVGDSIEQITGIGEIFQAMANADNRQMISVNWARSGAGLTATNSTPSWQIGNVIPAAQQAVQISYVNGTPTAGTWELDFPFGSGLLAVTGLAWNETAANLQTAINGVVGANFCTCTGGPLNSAAITITASASGAYSDAPWVVPVFNIANSALTVTPTVTGETQGVATTLTAIYSPGTTANSLWTQFVAEMTRVGATAVILQNGANDTANAAWQTALSAQIAACQAQGWKVLALVPQTRRTSAPDQPNATDDQPLWAFRGAGRRRGRGQLRFGDGNDDHVSKYGRGPRPLEYVRRHPPDDEHHVPDHDCRDPVRAGRDRVRRGR